MSTNVVSINDNNLIDDCISILKQDGVLAVPTDTIYGLAALVNTISIGTIDDLFIWSKPTLTKEQLSTGDLLPGPVTLMFERQSILPSYFNPDANQVALRIPNCQFMIELAQRLQEPIALTSANISNEPSAVCIQEFEALWPQIDLVIDGGLLTSNDRCGSTIVDLSEKGYFNIQRQGIDCERIVKYLKEHCQLKEKNAVF
ncbi:unnamed protein product [Rotaria socialis]